MTPRFPDGRGDDVQSLRRDVRQFATQMGEGAGLFPIYDQAIGTTETAIRHGLNFQPNDAFAFPQADARVWRTRAPDDRCVYFAASVAVTCTVYVL